MTTAASKKLKFVVEKNIPFIAGLLEPYGEVVYLESEDIDACAVVDADAVLVRTRTRCDASLLAGSRVSFVGTATIGMDHIDRQWCADNGITAVNAPGCNAPAVAQYVFSAIGNLINRPVEQYTLGIVGVGHVGSIVERWARALNMPVMLCDPPRQRAEGGDGWHTLAEVARSADIITFHTPLTRQGPDATWHLADDKFFNSIGRKPIIINAARGPVFDTEAVLRALDAEKDGALVIDTWEGEPSVPVALLERCDIGTPHIAGYSLEGKVRATRLVLDALTAHFGLPHIAIPGHETVPGIPRSISLSQAVNSYDIFEDSDALLNDPDSLESLRNHYVLRHEISAPAT